MANRSVERENDMRKTFRFTFSQEEHGDVIGMFDRCPKPLRSELVVLAMRVLEKNKHEILAGSKDNRPSPSTNNETQTIGIDITDAFKS